MAKTTIKLLENGNIFYQLHGKVICSRPPQPSELRNNGEYGPDDLVWQRVFGSVQGVQDFIRVGQEIELDVTLEALGYDPCDSMSEENNGAA